MYKPDRTGALVLAFIVFALYVDIGSILNSLSLASLPLIGFGTAAKVQVLLFSVAIMNGLIYLSMRQRKRAQTSPNPHQ